MVTYRLFPAHDCSASRLFFTAKDGEENKQQEERKKRPPPPKMPAIGRAAGGVRPGKVVIPKPGAKKEDKEAAKKVRLLNLFPSSFCLYLPSSPSFCGAGGWQEGRGQEGRCQERGRQGGAQEGVSLVPRVTFFSFVSLSFAANKQFANALLLPWGALRLAQMYRVPVPFCRFCLFSFVFVQTKICQPPLDFARVRIDGTLQPRLLAPLGTRENTRKTRKRTKCKIFKLAWVTELNQNDPDWQHHC